MEILIARKLTDIEYAMKQKRIDELILFERPLKISTKIVRGTFPDLRHIHYWRKTPITPYS